MAKTTKKVDVNTGEVNDFKTNRIANITKRIEDATKEGNQNKVNRLTERLNNLKNL